MRNISFDDKIRSQVRVILLNDVTNLVPINLDVCWKSNLSWSCVSQSSVTLLNLFDCPLLIHNDCVVPPYSIAAIALAYTRYELLDSAGHVSAQLISHCF